MAQLRSFAVVLLCLGLVSCKNSAGAPLALQFAYATLGELQIAIEQASGSGDAGERTDTDGDALPDLIEIAIGTDPGDRDSDRDGLNDNYELFGADFLAGDPLPDRDRDGLIAPLDDDDDNDFVNDGEVIDTDGDGVANYLEFYGYTYDVLTGRFQIWNGDPLVEHFRTDPLQRSTDQDAYSDGDEVAGRLDPTIQSPGDDPLVAAYPNIDFELVGYSVTLNEEIEVTQSISMERGTTWSSDMEKSYTVVSEVNFEAGVEGGTDTKVTAKVGGKLGLENSTSVTVSRGGSATNSEGWSQARSANPTNAAHVKLLIRVHNRGSAPVSNLAPTLTLLIGGLSVSTFEPGGSQVNILVPGAVYPANSAVSWVIERTSLGDPIQLTMGELRALEQGAPVSIVATQLRGEVTHLNDEGGWERLGETSEYVARCDAVCAKIRIDLGDGVTIDRLVYADDGIGGMPVTLGDALGLIGVSEENWLFYTDDQGIPSIRLLDDFNFIFDAQTLRDNGWQLKSDGTPTTEPPEGYSLRGTILFPTTDLLVRAPRPPAVGDLPVVHYAFLDPLTGEVRVSCADYQGIAEVSVTETLDPDDPDAPGPEVDLIEEISGTGFYFGTIEPDSDLASAAELQVTVTNAAGMSVTRYLGRLWIADEVKPPVIVSTTLREDDRLLYAEVQSGNPGSGNSAVAWVRAYNWRDDVAELMATSGFKHDDDGVIVEDPHGFSVVLPLGFDLVGLELVAFVAPGVYSLHAITVPNSLTVKRQGTVTLKPEVVDGASIFIKTFTWKWYYPSLNLDTGYAPRPSKFGPVWLNKNNPPPASDFWTRLDTPLFDTIHAVAVTKAHFYFHAPYSKLPPSANFEDLDGVDLKAAVGADSSTTALLIKPPTFDPTIKNEPLIEQGDMFALKTDDGSYAKIRILSIVKTQKYVIPSKSYTIKLEYVTYK